MRTHSRPSSAAEIASLSSGYVDTSYLPGSVGDGVGTAVGVDDGLGVGTALGAGDGINVSTATLCTETLAMIVEPAVAAWDDMDDESKPDEMAEFTEFATLPSVSPPSSVRLSVGTATSIDTVTEVVRRRLRRDEAVHAWAPKVAPERTSPNAAFNTASSVAP